MKSSNAYHIGFVLAIIGGMIAVTTSTGPHHWGVWFCVVVFIGLFGLLNYAADGETEAKRVRKILDKVDNVSIYSVLVEYTQSTAERFLTPHTLETAPKTKVYTIGKFKWGAAQCALNDNDLNALKRSTWSWPVLEGALRLALLYPILFMISQWTIADEAVGIQNIAILPDNISLIWRLSFAGSLLFMILLRYRVDPASENQRDELVMAALFTSSVVLAGSLVFFQQAVSLIDAASILALFWSAYCAVTVFSTKGNALIGLIFLWVMAFALTIWVATSDALLMAEATGKSLQFVVSPVLGFGLLFIVFGQSLVVSQTLKRRGLIATLCFVLVGIVVACLIVAQTPEPNSLAPFDVRLITFALATLPLINAVFDYISYGLTLQLIKKGRKIGKGLPLLLGLFDAIAALFLLFAVAFTLVCAIAFINHFAATPLLDIPQTLQDLKSADTRAPYTWLYLTLFTTLVPTLVHLAVAILSALTIVPRGYKTTIAHWISTDSPSNISTLGGTTLAALIGVIYAAFVTTAFMALWWALTTHLETLGIALINAVETAAHVANLI
ncbi:hypothetical protein [Ascidiaceihabitans sp.]|uniref:hypothetical protein n=1 Tax=Ascidiaceihabitans sp. TaxID=1872644 RepID=UPI0032993DB4